MQCYEMIREIFNSCSGNQMRDVFFEEIDTDDLNEYVKRFCKGTVIECERIDNSDGTVVFELNTDGIRQRVSFCES